MRGPKMRKTGLTTLAIILFTFSSLLAQSENPDEAYIKAMTASNPVQQAKLLKEYIGKYAGKGTQYENFAYANLCLLAYEGKTAGETIEYGEKALALGGLDDLTKCKILIQVSGLYTNLGQNLEKAKNYAFQAAQIAEANKKKESEAAASEQWNQLVGVGYFAQGQALEKAKNYKEAVSSYVNSYNITKNIKSLHGLNVQILKSLKKIGRSLYELKSYREAEKAFELPVEILKDLESHTLYARALHRNGRKEEALQHYKQVYAKQRSGDTAYNIGIILAEKAEKNPAFFSETIDYLLEASFLLSPPSSEKAMELAQSLFFTLNKDLKYNEKVKLLQAKNNRLQELTTTFNNKFADKAEDELSEADKKEIQSLHEEIKSEEAAIQKLEAEQKAALDKFNELIKKTKQKLDAKK